MAIDGTDISAEMLAVAARKKTYRTLFAWDLIIQLPITDSQYLGIISAGTFTTGHVGSNALDEGLRIACQAATIDLTTNARH